MHKKSDEALKRCRHDVSRVFMGTVLAHKKARFLSLSERSAMIGCLLEFVDICYNYIDAK